MASYKDLELLVNELKKAGRPNDYIAKKLLNTGYRISMRKRIYLLRRLFKVPIKKVSF